MLRRPRRLAVLAWLLASAALADTPVELESPPLDARAQLVLERLNAIRAAPGAQLPAFERLLAQEIAAKPERCAPEPELLAGLAEAAPRPPLAPLAGLVQVARAHAADMLARRFFAHVNPDGLGPNDRLRAAGFPLSRTVRVEGRTWKYSAAAGANQVEAIQRSLRSGLGRAQPEPDSQLALAVDSLIVDRCVPDRGHRRHLLGLSPLNAGDRELGVGVAEQTVPIAERPGWVEWQRTLVILTLNPAHEDRTLTGVLYEDRDGDGRYSLGEGLGGQTVAVEPQGLRTRTAPGGGYALPLPAGSEGELLALGQRAPFALGQDNVKLDLRR
ncbi:MAG: hypothetical protein H6741_10510 [Alphaproteobacteria bacterium]|nr:hypothetical protein [Alphaproteobacteria bacterium]